MKIFVGGKPATLVLDTGAEQTLLDAALAGVSKDDLKRAIARGGQSQTGSWTGAIIQVSDFCVGARCFEKRKVGVVDFEPLSKAAGRRIDGILGADLLREFDEVSINYKKSTVTLSSGGGK